MKQQFYAVTLFLRKVDFTGGNRPIEERMYQGTAMAVSEEEAIGKIISEVRDLDAYKGYPIVYITSMEVQDPEKEDAIIDYNNLRDTVRMAEVEVRDLADTRDMARALVEGIVLKHSITAYDQFTCDATRALAEKFAIFPPVVEEPQDFLPEDPENG